MVAAFVVTILPIAIHKPSTDEVLIYGGTTAAVKSVPVFYVDEVIIYQSPHYPQSLHELGLILLGKSSCDDLAPRVVSEATTYMSSSLPSNETLYLLKGSEMTFNICIVTNDLAHQAGAYLDFYIEEGLEYISKNQRDPRNRFHHALSVGYTANLSNQTQPTSEWNCSNNLKYTANENGYYSIIMTAPPLIHPTDILFWYNVTAVYNFIDINNLPHFCKYKHTFKESDPCYIKIQSSEHLLISQHQCVVVQVLGTINSDSFSNYGSIVIEYNSWLVGRSAFLGIGISVLIISAIVVVLVILLVCIYRARAWKKEQNKPPNVIN